MIKTNKFNLFKKVFSGQFILQSDLAKQLPEKNPVFQNIYQNRNFDVQSAFTQ